MSTVYVFSDSVSSTTGIGKVTTIHYQPEKLSDAQKERGFEVTLEPAPQVKAGYKAELYVNANDNSTFYNTDVDAAYYMPVSEFMSLLPLSTRVALKSNRAIDAVVDSFLDILEASRDDSSSKGVNPVSPWMVEYYTYFVSQAYMTDADVSSII